MYKFIKENLKQNFFTKCYFFLNSFQAIVDMG